jgi:orotate phosphoribosyltransferase
VLGVYADKDGDAFVVKRGYDKLVKGKRVLVVEDVLTTGGSVRKVVEATCVAGGEVIGVAALVNRGNVKTTDIGNVPALAALVSISLDAWDENDCPMCKGGTPVNTDVGKGREFLARKQA